MASETVPISAALNRVTAEPIRAAEPVPPFANSAMDGYAVRSADTADAPVRLRVLEDVPAGSVPTQPVVEGTATRIMTGAPLPEGADAVVMVERTSRPAGDVVEIEVGVEAGTSVRDAGSDVAVGDEVIETGVRLHPRHLGSIASVVGSVRVAVRPVVAVLSTGEEVVEPSTSPLAVGAIRDTNRVMLTAMLEELSIPFIDLGIVGDDPALLRRTYLEASDRADLIVSTGGVSMGDYDFVKQVLGETGSVDFWQVAMQPAKPFAFGNVGGVPLFGLPGNPVSTFVAFEQFVRPGLLSMMGARALLRPRIAATMGEDVDTNPEKDVFMRVLLADDGGRFVAVRSGGQASNVLSALAAAEALAVIPVGTGAVAAGDTVQLEMITWPETREAP
jgi:molybdenum cofactor synthesis domain-containing protein